MIKTTQLPRARHWARKTLCFLLISLCLLACSGGGGGSSTTAPPQEPAILTIGVLLPLSGPQDLGWRQTLDWAVDNFNKAAGPAKPNVRLEYADPNSEGLDNAAARLINDQRINVVIGPNLSSEVMLVAERFIRHNKFLISPSSTSEDVFKSYAGRKYIWRTVEADAAQVETMFTIAKAGGAAKVALITSDDVYGSTFFNWYGFLCAEMKMQSLGQVRYKPSETNASPYLAAILTQKPDALLAVALEPAMIVSIKDAVDRDSPSTRLILSDGAYAGSVLSALGAKAEGLEGTTATADPGSNFEQAYFARFARPAPDYSSNTYDALNLAALALYSSKGSGGDQLYAALVKITSGTGADVQWEGGMKSALETLDSGGAIRLRGASGPLDYDAEFHTDPANSYYAWWRVEGGEFKIKQVFKTGGARGGDESSVRDKPSDELRQPLSGVSEVPPATPKTGLWALLVAGSSQWQNYRHQADVLAQYDILKKNGVSDDRIILIMADDLAQNPSNPFKGQIQYSELGENIYNAPKIDYALSEVTAADILEILSGNSSIKFPTVIGSGPGDNVYVYLSGHGNGDGFFVNSSGALGPGEGTVLAPDALAARLETMKSASGYRQALIVVECCHSGVFGGALKASNALLLTASNAYENSLAHNLRITDNTWLSDRFSYELYRAQTDTPLTSLADAYVWAYQRVPGSHVGIYNFDNFDGETKVSIKDFITP